MLASNSLRDGLKSLLNFAIQNHHASFSIKYLHLEKSSILYGPKLKVTSLTVIPWFRFPCQQNWPQLPSSHLSQSYPPHLFLDLTETSCLLSLEPSTFLLYCTLSPAFTLTPLWLRLHGSALQSLSNQYGNSHDRNVHLSNPSQLSVLSI